MPGPMRECERHDGPRDESFTDRVAHAVRAIPAGRVTSYGRIAALAGKPRAARFVAFALGRAQGIPWHRVVRADGTIAFRDVVMRDRQMDRLVAEGVSVDIGAGRVDMARHGWNG